MHRADGRAARRGEAHERGPVERARAVRVHDVRRAQGAREVDEADAPHAAAGRLQEHFEAERRELLGEGPRERAHDERRGAFLGQRADEHLEVRLDAGARARPDEQPHPHVTPLARASVA